MNVLRGAETNTEPLPIVEIVVVFRDVPSQSFDAQGFWFGSQIPCLLSALFLTEKVVEF